MWKLLDAQGEPCLSRDPGRLGGHRRSKVYGRLDCPAALLALSKGGYRQHRVFFIDEPTAISAGFRPCGRCMVAEYRQWNSENRKQNVPRIITETVIVQRVTFSAAPSSRFSCRTRRAARPGAEHDLEWPTPYQAS
ncbi:Ada metal-binding domain-containing protein [Pseudomonas caricapapayae]|uniref:Ada metal-binding domain-containing protein n=1 Tax=Pseudomonas caricapapayae TaxID=46678 RepID=UPI0009FADCEB|nr:Ada metal-binding domain-containing protein [Pseudomonas caricapapayae]KAA8694680.1 hypothetical protein F4W67_15110 [Pseudomonas caricapapayae]